MNRSEGVYLFKMDIFGDYSCAASTVSNCRGYFSGILIELFAGICYNSEKRRTSYGHYTETF